MKKYPPFRIQNYDVHREAITRTGRKVSIYKNSPDDFDTSPSKPYAYYDEKSKAWYGINERGEHWEGRVHDADVVVWANALGKPKPKDLRDEFALAVLPALIGAREGVSHEELVKEALQIAHVYMNEREIVIL
jgi:hypothetical protein